jgi:hypothetical protein
VLVTDGDLARYPRKRWQQVKKSPALEGVMYFGAAVA